MRGSAKIEFGNLQRNCFALISWSLSGKSSLKVLQIETGERKRHFLSVSGSTGNPAGRQGASGANIIKINGKLGKALKLKDGDHVLFSEIDDQTTIVTSAKVSCCSSDDWEILESNAEFVSSNLLDQLRVVYRGQEFPFWLSKSMVIHLKIDEIIPGTEFGVLASNTEVIIPSLTPSTNFSFPATMLSHQKLRALQVSLPESFYLLPTETLLLSNELHGFTYRTHINLSGHNHNEFPQDSVYIKILSDAGDETQTEGETELTIRLFFVDAIDSKTAKEILPFANVPSVYLHPTLLKKAKITPKSWIWVKIIPENKVGQTLSTSSSVPRALLSSGPQSSEFCGFSPVIEECKNFIQSSLSLNQQDFHHSLTGPEFGCLLIHGPPGSGRSSIAKRVAESLSGPPYFVHFYHVSCAKLRGKKSENIEKEIVKSLQAIESMQPSLLILDDFDLLTASQKAEEQSKQEEFLQFKTCEMLLETVMRYKSNRLGIICIALNIDSLNPYWKSRPGFHFFQKYVKVPTPTKSERLDIFSTCLKRYLSDSGNIDLGKRVAVGSSNGNGNKENLISTKAGTGAIQYHGASLASNDNNSDLTKEIVAALCSIHEQNATPQFLQNVAKKWGAYLQQQSLADNYYEEDVVAIADAAAGHVSTSTASGINNSATNEDVNEQMSDFNEILEEEIRFSGHSDELMKNKHNQKQRISWDSVGGLTNVKQELKKILEWPIKFPQFFKNSPIPLPCGILFYGYPGTGKSLMGLAIQTIVNVKYIHVKGPELLSKYIGASEQAVQDVFARARDSRPCILFFDEFDSLVPRRGHDSSGVTDRVVNQFLSEMDGVDGGLGEDVYLIAATSRPDLIDPAVLRPGRLDKHLFFDFPNPTERKEIVAAIGSQVNLQLEDESDWNEICSQTEGFTGADLNALMFSSQLAVVHEHLSKLNNGDGDGAQLEGQSSSSVSSAAATTTSSMSRQEIKVRKESVLCALKDFKPSVQGKELRKFQAIYQGFSLSKSTGAKELSTPGVGTKLLEEGDEAQVWKMVPGKRATLA